MSMRSPALVVAHVCVDDCFYATRLIRLILNVDPRPPISVVERHRKRAALFWVALLVAFLACESREGSMAPMPRVMEMYQVFKPHTDTVAKRLTRRVYVLTRNLVGPCKCNLSSYKMRTLRSTCFMPAITASMTRQFSLY